MGSLLSSLEKCVNVHRHVDVEVPNNAEIQRIVEEYVKKQKEKKNKVILKKVFAR